MPEEGVDYNPKKHLQYVNDPPRMLGINDMPRRQSPAYGQPSQAPQTARAQGYDMASAGYAMHSDRYTADTLRNSQN